MAEAAVVGHEGFPGRGSAARWRQLQKGQSAAEATGGSGALTVPQIKKSTGPSRGSRWSPVKPEKHAINTNEDGKQTPTL